MTGLAAQVSNTGILWNIDPAVVPDWASYVDSNGGTLRPVTETMFMKAAQEVNVRSGEEIPICGSPRPVCSRPTPTCSRRCASSSRPTQLRGGYKGLDMSNVNQGNTGSNTVSMYWDKDSPDSTAYGITTRRFNWYKMSDWEFMEEDGAVAQPLSPTWTPTRPPCSCTPMWPTDGRNAREDH